MKIHEKIKLVRKDLGFNLQEVFDRGVHVFGKKSLSYRTLQRIEQGDIAKFSSILKICCALGVSLEKLIKDTELEGRLVIRKNERLDEFTYNDKVQAHVVSSPSRSFLALEMALQAGGKTSLENSPLQGTYEKWIYVVEGSLTCYLGNEKFILEKKDTISFDSATPHYFENPSKKSCLCIVITNPKHF